MGTRGALHRACCWKRGHGVWRPDEACHGTRQEMACPFRRTKSGPCLPYRKTSLPAPRSKLSSHIGCWLDSACHHAHVGGRTLKAILQPAAMSPCHTERWKCTHLYYRRWEAFVNEERQGKVAKFDYGKICSRRELAKKTSPKWGTESSRGMFLEFGKSGSNICIIKRRHDHLSGP